MEESLASASPPSIMTRNGSPQPSPLTWIRYLFHYLELHSGHGAANALRSTKKNQINIREQALDCKLVLIQFIPKPSHKHKYCSICKSNYEDYLDHIQSSSHKKSISKSKYTKHVLDLCSSLFKTQETVKLVSDDSTK